MNVVYANLKIALYTEERSFVQRIADCLSGHTVIHINPNDPSATSKKLFDSSPDFLFVDADGDPDRALKLVISAAPLNRIIFFMGKLDQRLVLAAKERGADAVLLKETSDDRIRERMEDLLSDPREDETILYETPIQRAAGVLGILFTHTPRQAIHLIMDYLHNR